MEREKKKWQPEGDELHHEHCANRSTLPSLVPTKHLCPIMSSVVSILCLLISELQLTQDEI